MMWKLDLAIAFAVIAGCALWIEHRHRVVIEAPAMTEVAATAPCPDSDTVPYSASCLAFLGRGFALSMSWQANAAAPARGPY